MQKNVQIVEKQLRNDRFIHRKYSYLQVGIICLLLELVPQFAFDINIVKACLGLHKIKTKGTYQFIIYKYINHKIKMGHWNVKKLPSTTTAIKQNILIRIEVHMHLLEI
jgi:hypothetical protein